jgi:hypothetical protein
MPSGIFISYRRQDFQMAAGRLAGPPRPPACPIGTFTRQGTALQFAILVGAAR